MELTWETFKAFATSKGLRIQYVELGNTYYLFASEGSSLSFRCSLYKDNSADVQDFENNFKSETNKPLVLKTDDARNINVTNRIPLGYTVYPTGRADNIANGTYGNGTKLKFDANTTSASFQMLSHWYGIGGRLIWESATLDDEVSATLIAPATTGLTQTTGDYTKVNIAGPYNKIKPVTEGTGDWSLDLTAKLTNTQILKCTPVPTAGNTGWFDYNSDTNVLTRNMTQTGGYDLYDFDVNLFKFANTIYGRKQDGAESILEATDVIGKLLFNSWKITFTLTPVTQGVRCGIIITTATKKNT